MTNPLKGEVNFESDGKQYTFKLGMNAQAVIEERTGMPLAKFLKQDRLEDLGAKEVRLIFWAGLHRQHPDITEEQVGDLIDAIGAVEAAALLVKAVEAVSASNPEKKNGMAGAPRPPKPARERTGTHS